MSIIGFIGAMGVGKTTVAKRVSEELRIPFIPESLEAAEEWANYNDLHLSKGRVFDHFDETFAEWFPYMEGEDCINFETGLHHSQAEREDEAGPRFITDTSPVIRAAAAIYFCGLKWPEQTRELVDFSMNRIGKFGYLFYIPMRFAAEYDGKRIIDPLVNLALDSIQQALARTQRKPLVHVCGLTVEERVDFVLKQVRR